MVIELLKYITIYFLIGFVWSDLMIFLIHRYLPTMIIQKIHKVVLVVLWPVSILFFIYGSLMGLFNYLRRSRHNGESEEDKEPQ